MLHVIWDEFVRNAAIPTCCRVQPQRLDTFKCDRQKKPTCEIVAGGEELIQSSFTE
jgi:hypothetical protein